MTLSEPFDWTQLCPEQTPTQNQKCHYLRFQPVEPILQATPGKAKTEQWFTVRREEENNVPKRWCQKGTQNNHAETYLYNSFLTAWQNVLLTGERPPKPPALGVLTGERWRYTGNYSNVICRQAKICALFFFWFCFQGVHSCHPLTALYGPNLNCDNFQVAPDNSCISQAYPVMGAKSFSFPSIVLPTPRSKQNEVCQLCRVALLAMDGTNSAPWSLSSVIACLSHSYDIAFMQTKWSNTDTSRVKMYGEDIATRVYYAVSSTFQ